MECKNSSVAVLHYLTELSFYLWNKPGNLCMLRHGNCMNVPQIIHINDPQFHKEKKNMPYFQVWKFCYCINHTCIWISSFVYLLFGLGPEGTQPHDYRNPLCHLQSSFKVILNSSNSALLITMTTNFPWKHHLNIMSYCLQIVYFQW